MADRHAKPRRILVIDDNEDFSESLCDVMEMNAHEVDVALTGNDGIRAAGRKAYDVIFVDVRLPDINGVECAKRIRQGDSAIRILLMTGYSPKELPELVEALGNAQLLTKPIDPELILAQIT